MAATTMASVSRRAENINTARNSTRLTVFLGFSLVPAMSAMTAAAAMASASWGRSTTSSAPGAPMNVRGGKVEESVTAATSTASATRRTKSLAPASIVSAGTMSAMEPGTLLIAPGYQRSMLAV